MQAKTKIILLLFFLAVSSLALAQTEEDIQGFLATGQINYNKGDLLAAALEFENVIMIDPQNFSAKVWLAQVYADLKDKKKALRFLRQAASQAPDHPRVIRLQKLLGEISQSGNASTQDPASREALLLLGKDTRLRKYGLVIPEDKVSQDSEERQLLVFDDLVVREEKKEKPLDLSILGVAEGPLAPALKAWENKGLAAGLDEYFSLVINDPFLAAHSDKGLVAEGRDFYIPRLKNNPEDIESRYYAGMISFIDGMYAQADLLLTDYRQNPGEHAQILTKVFARIDEWKNAEKERLLALKRAEEEKLAAELAEKERQEKLKQRKDVWASLQKNKGKDEQSAETPGSAEAFKLHEEGYELYKKGKLEEAIDKFTAAIAKDGGNGQFHYHLGLAWTDKGLAGDAAAFDRAIEEFQRVIALAPDDKLAKDSQSMIRDIESAKTSLGN
jgi:tetratricopeptide (TPR) repeat protein